MLKKGNLFYPVSKCLVFFTGIFISGHLFSNEIFVKNEESRITVLSESEYIRNENIEGFNISQEERSIGFSLSESETLSEITLYVIRKGKKQKLNASDLLSKSTMDWGSFFSGTQRYFLRIPPSTEFQLSFETRAKETIFLSKIYRNGLFGALNCTFTMSLPDNLSLTTNTGKTFSEPLVFIDSTSFKDDAEAIYFLVHTKNTKPEDYFSGWFENRISPNLELDEKLLPAKLTELSKNGISEELAKACFKFVQKEIRYLDIENGINAIVPRPVNQTLTNRYGDCKDMAALLHALLKNFGFQSYLSISRTIQKTDTFNFPSIAMANHMIVTLKLNGKNYFLDATESDCLFGDPSLQILGTEVFQIGIYGGYFCSVPGQMQHVPGFKLSYVYSLSPANTPYLQGELHVSEKLNTLFQALNDQQELLPKTRDLFAYLFSYPVSLDTLMYTEHETMIRFHGEIPAAFKNQVGENYYLDLKSIPSPNLLLEVLTGRSYALFPLDLSLSIKGIDLKTDLALSEHITLNKNGVNDNQLLFHLSGKNSQKEGEITSFWNNLIRKPFKMLN